MDTNGNETAFANTAAVKQLQTRLNEDRTVQAIDRLLDRIDVLEKTVANLTTIIEQGPGMVAMTADIADETYRKMQAKGIDMEQRLNAALHIADKLTAPEMVAKLDKLIALTDQVPGLSAMTIDMVDETFRNAKAKGIDIEERLSAALQLANELTAPQRVEQLNQLLQLADQAPGLIAMTVDVVDEEMKNAKDIDLKALIEIGTRFSDAVSRSKELPPTKVGGIFSMLRTMRDPDRQRAIGYMMNIAKAWGQGLKEE